jgi:predicted alpha/beta hydrolase
MSDEPQRQPQKIAIKAADGYTLKSYIWRHDEAGNAVRPVVIINPATAVRCRYYGRFASFLHAHGFDVITYDYRGIGESRPPSLKNFRASWVDWGRLDFEAILNHAVRHFPGQPIQVVGHSVGGFLIGLAASSHRIQRIFTMGAQFAYWKDYALQRRLQLLLKWHLVMPLLTRLVGYFPGRRLGWLEDIPRGVVRDWTASCPQFEDNYRKGYLILPASERRKLVEQFANIHAPTLALGMTDDAFGTVQALQRLLRYYRNSDRTHIQLPPQALGISRVGHFTFFHSRFRDKLWQIPLAWLRDGHIDEALDAHVIPLLPTSH